MSARGAFGSGRRWLRLFEGRSRQSLRFDAIPAEAREHSDDLALLLRAALFCEESGVAVLERKAREEADPDAARCIALHAAEERGHVAVLASLLEEGGRWEARGPVLWAERVLARDRSLPEQMLATLVVEAVGVAVYEMVAKGLGGGRAAAVLRSIADDERIHLDFTRELLVSRIQRLSPREMRRLKRLRSRLVFVIVTAHWLGHRRFLRRVTGLETAAARGCVLGEIERSLSSLPGLAVPRSA